MSLDRINIAQPSTGTEQSRLADRPGWPRRRFLQWATLGGASAGLASLTHPQIARSQGASTTLNPTPIKVGILVSLSGIMASLEVQVVEAVKLAIAEINQAGGVLGRPLVAIVEDAQSAWPVYTEKAEKLILQHQVATVFGCWTSSSRKAVLRVFERYNHLLWYPVAYEGQECSRNILYTGAVPNQQVEPAIAWLLASYPDQPWFLAGSDYVYPRTVNQIAKATLANHDRSATGEVYLPLGETDMTALIQQLQQTMPQGGVILNSLTGDSNAAFFQALSAAGLAPDRYPCLSFDLTEDIVNKVIGPQYLVGHYAVGNYFQTIPNGSNRRFVNAYQAVYGRDRWVTAPIVAAYTAVYLWKQAVERAKIVTDQARVRQASYGLSMESPAGRVMMMPNHHLSLPVWIGQVQADGLFDLVWQGGTRLPQPWSQQIQATRGYSCDWSRPDRGGRYRR